MVVWKFNGMFKADAEIVSKEIETIENATPQNILEYAKNENTELHKCFDNLDKETIKNVSTQVNEIIVKIDQLMKALALAQDKTAEGKIALLNLISENTTQADTKEVVTEVKETVSITEAKAEPIKKYIIANSTVQMHKKLLTTVLCCVKV